MAIRWADFPHKEIFGDIYSRLNKNAVEHSADDSLQHILRRRLHFLGHEEHRKFIELESRHIVERLRCTRDAYRVFTDSQGCSPVAEAYWVILRFAILPTAIASLKQSVFRYVKLTRVRAADLSFLFGIPTRPVITQTSAMILESSTPVIARPANYDEMEWLAATVLNTRMLMGGGSAFGHPFGGGPFSIDDITATGVGMGVVRMREHITLLNGFRSGRSYGDACIPWTEGLTALFGCVQDELLAQWKSLTTRRQSAGSQVEGPAVRI